MSAWGDHRCIDRMFIFLALVLFLFYIFLLCDDIPSDNLYEKINKNEKSYVMYHQWSDDTTTPVCFYWPFVILQFFESVFTWPKGNIFFSSLVKWIEPFPIDGIPPIFIWPTKLEFILSFEKQDGGNFCSRSDWSAEIY